MSPASGSPYGSDPNTASIGFTSGPPATVPLTITVTAPGNLDGVGDSYSAQALAAATPHALAPWIREPRLTCGTQPSRTVRRTAAKAPGSLRKPS
jgi:hypothetical protein